MDAEPFVFRPALPADLDAVCALIDDARVFLRSQGIDQWQHAYPTRQDLLADLTAGIGWLALTDTGAAGYFCLTFAPEPCYEAVAQSWVWRGLYGVIHRMALAPRCRGVGLSRALFAQAEALCRAKGAGAIKVDTHPDNHRMQHVLAQNGYARRGVVEFEGPKLAFEKLL